MKKIMITFFYCLTLLACSEVDTENANLKAEVIEKQLVKIDNSGSSSKTNAQQYAGFDWTLTNLEGKPLTLSDYQGKPVMLFFWATWCPYCKKLFPGVNRVYEKYKDQGLTLIAMNIREDGDPKAYIQERGFNFEVALEADEIANHYEVIGTPTIIFIDATGKVLAKTSISDPDHPVWETFARQQLGLESH